MQDFIYTLPALNLLFAEITLEGTIQPFVTAIIFIGMIVALMLPILAIPYIFIKMGGAMAKIVSAGNSMVKRGVKKGAGDSKYGQAFKQAKSIRASNRAQMGQSLLRKHGGKAGGVLLGGVSKEGRDMGARRLDVLEREHRDKEVSRIKKDMVDRGETGDDALRTRATHPTASHYERAAAMELAAESGRVGVLRDVQERLSDSSDVASFNEAVRKNSGVIDKAPDLNVATDVRDAAGNLVGQRGFSDFSATDASKLKSNTLDAVHHDSGRRIGSVVTDEQRAGMLRAYDQAMSNPQLSKDIDEDTRNKWEALRAKHNSRPGAAQVLPPPQSPSGGSGTPPQSPSGGSGTPPPPPPTGSGTPPLPPGASGGRSGSVGPSGLWTPGP